MIIIFRVFQRAICATIDAESGGKDGDCDVNRAVDMNGWLRSIPPRLARAPRTAARPLLPFETLLLRCDVEEVLRALVRFFLFLCT